MSRYDSGHSFEEGSSESDNVSVSLTEVYTDDTFADQDKLKSRKSSNFNGFRKSSMGSYDNATGLSPRSQDVVVHVTDEDEDGDSVTTLGVNDVSVGRGEI